MKDLKYLTAYAIPILVILSILAGGYFVFSTVIFAFIFVPIFEPLLKESTANYTDEEKHNRLSNKLFDVLLFLNLPLIIIAISLFLVRLNTHVYSTIEIVGLVSSLGVLLGSSGINVAHELGHRDEKFSQFWAKLLLVPCLYMHFYIEHNRGHHKNAATEEDPASARYDENLYSFWIRSASLGYLHAWKLEQKRLSSVSKTAFSLSNEMVRFTLIQLVYLLAIALLFSWKAMFLMAAAAVIGFLLLETINYVEHYGLQRKKMENGRYERVEAWHSWNSNHQFGRIILYDLTRHSDHHFQSNKKYQILEHHDSSPQLPYGYPTSMLLSMIPPLWFRIMNKEVLKYSK